MIPKSVRFATSLGAFFLKVGLHAPFLKTEAERRHFLANEARKDSQRLLKKLNFEVSVFGYDRKVHDAENFLIVSNHMSYLDPLIMMTAIPSLFITSVDMGEVPGLGQICRAGGCIFVERRNRNAVDRDLGQMNQALASGLNVTIYPEGTSSNGKTVLPFKKSLLMAAVAARRRVLPVVLKYVEIDGLPFSSANADSVCWHGDMTFLPHFIKLMKLKSLKAELYFLEPIETHSELTRDELASRSFAAISGEYSR